MKELVVPVPNRPGELAKVAEVLADNNINIKSIATESLGRSEVYIKIISNGDAKDAARVLQEKGKYKVQVNPLLIVSLVDRPGELAKIAKALATLGVNVNSVYVVGNETGKNGKKATQVALNVDNYAQAQKALAPFIVREETIGTAVEAKN